MAETKRRALFVCLGKYQVFHSSNIPREPAQLLRKPGPCPIWQRTPHSTKIIKRTKNGTGDKRKRIKEQRKGIIR